MRNERDMSVELARILACLIVIGVHSCLAVYRENYYDLNRVFISCLFADGVAVFWLIMGGFLFKNLDYKRLIQKTLRSVGIPMIGITVFTFYLSGWAIDGMPLLQSISHTKEDYIYIFQSLLAWEPPGYVGYLWYLYTYLMVILCFPILKSFAEYLDGSKKRIKVFLVISFLFLVVNDMSNNRLAAFSHHSINALIPASLEVLWGHILYSNKDKFANKKGILFGTVVFVVLNVFRTIIQFVSYNMDKGNHILYWYTSIGLICSISLMMFCFSVMRRAKKRIKKLVGFIAGHTLNIYLFHSLVIAKLQRYSIQDELYEYVVGFTKSCVGDFIYTGLIVLLVFFLSMCISVLFRAIKYIWKRLFKARLLL